MQIEDTIGSLRLAVSNWRERGHSVAFVPTMGNLHAGHLRLVETARQHADRVVVSIFVNPTQFGEGEDFDSYPRTPAEDVAQLHEVGTALLFTPSIAEVYPVQNRTAIEVRGLSDELCGAHRPGHFSGVATVVCKLLNMVQPDMAFFGEKDFQQLIVIRSMVDDLNMPVRIQGVATVREADGLAMSSRNAYLTEAERKLAPKLYQTLCSAADYIRSGERRYRNLEQRLLDRLRDAGFEPDYVTVRCSGDLAVAGEQDRALVILAAARLGKARLIDNLQFTLSDD
ncbi:MAG: pantoate--beta-alanine ligase [Pseudomonadota bacterium]